MAHVDKFARGATGHLAAHFERKQDEDGQYVKFGNQDIDTALSGDNYNLAPERNMSQTNFIRQRCSQVQCLKRKDVKVLCSWVVTAPKSLAGSPEESKFFAEAYKFLEEKYGKENTVSAYVHKDEITPHMHFAFVPVVTDQRSGQLKVSAKERLPKSELKSFHTELSRHMEQAFGRDIGILNEATRNGNKSIEELKRGTAIKELQALSADVAKSQNELDNLQKTILDISGVQEVANKAHKGMLGGLKGVKYSEYQQLLKTAARVDEADKLTAAAEQQAVIAKKEAATVKAEVQAERQGLAEERVKLDVEKARVEKLKEETPSKQLLKRNLELSAENQSLKAMVSAVTSLLKYSGKAIKSVLATDKPALERVERIEKALELGKSQSRGIER